MDSKAGVEFKSRQWNPSLPELIGNKEDHQETLELHRWQFQDIHRPNLHRKAVAVPTPQVRSPSLHYDDVHKWQGKRVFLQGWLREDDIDRIQPKK